MAKVTYLDDLQQMQADHIWGKVRKMRKQKLVAKGWIQEVKPTSGIPTLYIKRAPYPQYRSKVAAKFAGRAAKVAHKLISLGDY